jgi:peptidylprolyl isomerase
VSARSPLAGLVVGALLVLTGCSASGDSLRPSPSASAHGLDGVRIAAWPQDGRPTVELSVPVSVSASQRKVLAPGTGPVARAGQRVTIDYVGYNGTDGKEFDTSYGSRPASFVLSPEGNLPGLIDGLTGTPAGSRLLLALPPQEAYGLKGSPAAGIGPTDTIVLVVQLEAVKDVLTQASGKAVKPKPGLPTVKVDAKGVPTITVPGSNPPTTLVIQQLVIGTGPPVARGQQITVQYTGVLWPGGKQFDSSWPRSTPASFLIGEGKVIAGWDRGLVGQPVGSRVLLVIPPDDGYGAEGKPAAGIRGTDTLVFVVDILDAA